MHTLVSAVQLIGRFETWGEGLVYVGMPGRAARAYGIEDDAVGPFGKPWWCLKAPEGWLAAYRKYVWRLIQSDADFALAVRDLHGKTLVCWCRAKAAGTQCHADTLAAAAEYLFHGIEAIEKGDGPPLTDKARAQLEREEADHRARHGCNGCEEGWSSTDEDRQSPGESVRPIFTEDDDPWYIDPGGYDIRYER